MGRGGGGEGESHRYKREAGAGWRRGGTGAGRRRGCISTRTLPREDGGRSRSDGHGAGPPQPCQRGSTAVWLAQLADRGCKAGPASSLPARAGASRYPAACFSPTSAPHLSLGVALTPLSLRDHCAALVT